MERITEKRKLCVYDLGRHARTARDKDMACRVPRAAAAGCIARVQYFMLHHHRPAGGRPPAFQLALACNKSASKLEKPLALSLALFPCVSCAATYRPWGMGPLFFCDVTARKIGMDKKRHDGNSTARRNAIQWLADEGLFQYNACTRGEKIKLRSSATR